MKEIREMVGNTHLLTCTLVDDRLYETLVNLDVKNPVACYTSEEEAIEGHARIKARYSESLIA